MNEHERYRQAFAALDTRVTPVSTAKSSDSLVFNASLKNTRIKSMHSS